MSSSPPELTASKNDRIYSAETDDSPFGSSLVTPTDEDLFANQGIHGRLDVAESILGYFGSKEIVSEVEKGTHTLQNDIGEVVDIKQSEQGLGDVKEGDAQDMSPSLSSNMDSSQAVAAIVLSSSSSESIQRPLTTGLYTLPNDHIIVQSDSNNVNVQKEEQQLIDSNSVPLVKQPDLGTSFWSELAPAINELTCRALVLVAIRLIFFLPWCIVVGGALVFSPDHLDYITFRTGYLEALHGIRRYAHFSEYGFQHIIAFLTFLGLVTWMAPTAGFLCIGGLMAQFCWAWHSFLVDRNISMGEDDRQTVYLLATSTWLNDATIHIRKIGDSYYAAEKSAEDVSIAPTGGDSKGILAKTSTGDGLSTVEYNI